jgi:hemolysin activation/secretion protein
MFPAAGGALAQALPTPGAVQQQQRETQETLDLQKRLQEQAPSAPEVIDRTQRPKPGAPGSDVRIQVKKVDVGASQVLTDDEIRSVVRRYEGREISIADLFVLVDEINALYKERGCLTCRAFLPAQTVEEGRVEVRLVEARASELEIEGNASTRESFLRGRISTRKGDLFDVNGLERDLARINATTDLQTTAELKAGTEPGTVTPIVHVVEPPHYSLTLFTDNAGAETVGEYRAGLTFTDASVFGWRDAFFLNVYGAEGTSAVTTSYTLPVHSSGTKVGLSYDYSDIKVVSGPFEALDIGGYASRVGLDLTQPLIANTKVRLNALANATSRTSVSTFSGIKISELDVRSAGLGFDLQAYGDSGDWFTRNLFTQGFHDFGGDREFLRFNTDVYRVQALTPSVTAQLRFSAQWADSHPLPSTEQFQIGGVATVRGYREGILAGDEGGILSAELQFPVPETYLPGGVHWRGFTYADYGVVVQQRDGHRSVNHDDMLYSVGAGLSFTMGTRLSGKLALGIPLNATPGYDDGDYRIEFFVQALLF